MNSKAIGILIGVAVGIGLIWHFRKKFPGMGPLVKRVPITLKVRPDGGCGIEEVPPVTLRRREPMQWEISNPKGGCPCTVDVCITKWTKGGVPSESPVNSDGNCRSVSPGQTKILPARAKDFAAPGDYYYEVHLDGTLALDPIVRIVLV